MPTLYLGVIDKYGQIVGSDSSKVLIYVNSSFNQETEANEYPPVIEGNNQFYTSAGVVKIANINFDGTPGFDYQLIG